MYAHTRSPHQSLEGKKPATDKVRRIGSMSKVPQTGIDISTSSAQSGSHWQERAGLQFDIRALFVSLEIGCWVLNEGGGLSTREVYKR
jgi:hypothetical protein